MTRSGTEGALPDGASSKGCAVDGRWEMSVDGVTCDLDFELTRTRVR
ncbi:MULTISPECIES: hypothetical protein [unclassified Streptosporangium]|nr:MULTISPECIES: hypothetical protein [unclassified Streptosporangium]